MITNSHWIDSAYLYDKYNAPGSKEDALSIIDDFFAEYPTPEQWVQNPHKKHFTGLYNSLSEFWYILAWMHESNLWENSELQPLFIDYFVNSGNTYTSMFNLAISQGYITKADLDGITQIDPTFNKSRLCFICICLKKNFKELSEADVDSILLRLKKGNITYLRLQNILMKLGYSSTKVQRKPRNINWPMLENHPQFGQIFSIHHKYLIVGGATTRYLSRTGGALKNLVTFMKENNLEDFSVFTPVLFEQLIQYLSTHSNTGNYPLIKKFFQTNAGEPLFPKELHFCDVYWSAYTMSQKKLNRRKDGRAFSELSLPVKIVNILKNYTPGNEVELLCRNFYLIISSCPARFSYILGLDAQNALQPLPNNPNAYGVYSQFADKAGNIYGQFPILDKLGVDAIKELQHRAERLNLRPISDKEHDVPYIHLFQLTERPWLLNHSILNNFYSSVILDTIKAYYPHDTELRATAHSFRHYLITHVAMKTGDEAACQTAAGHKDVLMTREYLRSKSSRTMLLFRVLNKYENKEITGKFYLRLIELLSSPDTPTDTMLYALTTEMELDQFLATYGQRMDMGYCFGNPDCPQRHACWDCTNFIMTKNEITQAIHTICHQIIELKNMQSCKDFSFEVSIVKHKLKLISLIIKRLTELDLSQEEVTTMINNCFTNNELTKGVTPIHD